MRDERRGADKSGQTPLTGLPDPLMLAEALSNAVPMEIIERLPGDVYTLASAQAVFPALNFDGSSHSGV